jgi:hypothetical protein
VISEGIDLLVTQMGLTEELAKAGKGVQLRRAVEYIADLGDRLGGYEKEVEDLRKEKQDLEVSPSRVSDKPLRSFPLHSSPFPIHDRTATPGSTAD